MPLYEYHCTKCRSTFELLRPISQAERPAPCPAGHRGATRVFSLVAARSWGGAGSTEASLGGGGCACGGGSCGCAR
jgi:putative FmdB family regulatory protein